ncbi:MAG TPA: hypothetical protein VFL57_16725 [Bryobacteraceae bacterium]|nr:hypothetical protein [Bryobacteraceae bacterium]
MTLLHRLAAVTFAYSVLTTAQQPPAAPKPRLLTVAPGTTVRVPARWQPSAIKYSNAQELVLSSQARVAGAQGQPPQTVDYNMARILITREPRTTHADAVKRLQEIAAERPFPARFVEIGGWPAVEIDFQERLPRRGQAAQVFEANVPQAAIAVAAGTTLIRFDIALAPDAEPALLEEARQIARSSVFPTRGNPATVKRSLDTLQREGAKPVTPPVERGAPPDAAVLRDMPSPAEAPRAGIQSPGLALVQAGVGELEIAASANARNIVIASNAALSFSANLGATFTAGNTGVFGLNDPTLARAASGNFYLGVIAFPNGTPAHLNATGCTNAVSRSTDNGATFTLRGYSARCPATGTGLCFPDQEHIAADAVNQAAGNDQLYAAWRNFTPAGPVTNCGQIGGGFVTSTITCSQNGGTTWTANAAVPGGGDFPRVAVGRDGSVYVVRLNGNNVVLNRFSSCATGLVAATGFPVTVATLSGGVACPMPGLDRCNDGNTLSSPTVAPDPGNANRVFVSFAERDGSGGERVVTRESNDRGATFPRTTTVSGSNSARRFMPWTCSTRGRAFTGWYDRSAATAAANDRTDYFFAQAWGGLLNLTNNPDPQCASGWPCAPRSTQDSESCSVQPQLAGVCQRPGGGGSGARCDFSAGGCPAGESCMGGGGCPKYGDYNGIACAGNWVIAGWASATSPQGLPAGAGLRVFSTSVFVGWEGAPIWRYTGIPCAGNSCPGWQRLDNNPKTVAIASAGTQLYQLHNDGWIWRYTGTACDVDICPGWQRLDNNSKTIAIAAGGSQLYQLHNDGWIWRYTGTPCAGNSCPGWQRLDNNSKTIAITANSGDLFQLHNDGRIWRYTGTPCSGNSCPGWQQLDANPSTVAIAAAGSSLFQLHRDGRIWRYTGTPCTGNSCPGWQMLDNNSKTVAIAAGGSQLYQLHNDGWIWRYTGTPCAGNSCPGWQRLDNNSKTVAIAAGDSALYQLHHDGWIWRYTGTPCTGNSCPGWQRLDNNPRTGMIASGGQLFQLHTDPLYQVHNDGWIWRYIGTECDGDFCPGWQRLDNNPATVQVVAAGTQSFQRHKDGKIWRHTGVPCAGNSCPGWQMLDNNPATVFIAAAGNQLFQLHNNGRIWRYTGTPCSSATSCPGWQMLDANAATVAIAAGGNQLFQLHNSGRIWRYTGTPCSSATACPGWQMLDANAATVAIAAAGNQLFQMHKGGRIWRHTGAPCTSATACPGWQMLDTNPATTAIAAGGNQLYQLHNTGRIWRYTGTPCTSATTCPGWQLLDTNPATTQIVATADHLYQRHTNGRIWRYVGPPCTGTSCPGWRLLDNNPKTIRIVSGGFE